MYPAMYTVSKSNARYYVISAVGTLATTRRPVRFS